MCKGVQLRVYALTHNEIKEVIDVTIGTFYLYEIPLSAFDSKHPTHSQSRIS